MKTHYVVLSAVLLVLFLGARTPQFAQDSEKIDQAKYNHTLLLGLLRTINTAEATDFSRYGSYSSWQTLMAHQPEYLNGWLAGHYSHKAEMHFGDVPEILVGWRLRLNIHIDGNGYDVLVEDATDKDGYAALSDERGAIRECKWLR